MRNKPVEDKASLIGKVLTKEAIERLGRIKIKHPIVASQLETYLIQVYQAGQIEGKIDDNKLKQVLAVLLEKRDMKIQRKRK